MKKKILLAVDCFDQSLSLVRYFSKMFLPEKHEAVLFHVELPGPDTLMDTGEELPFSPTDIPVNGWIKKNREATAIFLDEAKAVLAQAGFDAESVTIRWEQRKRGVARDIADESRKGYDLLMLGRSETHAVNDTCIGSVASKLLTHCRHIPMAIVGGSPETDRVLIGFDRSEGSMGSVDFICTLLRNPTVHITLCHVIRSLIIDRIRKRNHKRGHDVFDPMHERDWQHISRERIRPSMDRALKLLEDGSWPPHRLHEKIIVDAEARSQSLVDEARREGCGTIVVGRHGMSMVKEFFLGRVGHKVVHMAHNHAVWIIA